MEEDEQVFEEISYQSNDIIDVIGSGVLNEVCQQRGDEDSRRYRVFQHYLRTSGLNDKKQMHQSHWDHDHDGQDDADGDDQEQNNLSFSSDSEKCHD